MGEVIPLYPTKWTVRKEDGRWLAQEWRIHVDRLVMVNQVSVRTWEAAMAAVLLTISLREW